jgi:hypothetical protein
MNLVLRFAVTLFLHISLLIRFASSFFARIEKVLEKQAKRSQGMIENRMRRRGKINVQFALCLLDGVMREADRLGIKPFLVSGTLLGFHREGSLLLHDYDLDLGIMHDDSGLPALLAAIQGLPSFSHLREVRLSERERVLNPWLSPLSNSTLIYKAYFNQPDQAKKLGIDLFVHANIQGYFAHATVRTVWINRPFAIIRKSFGERSYWVPEDIDLYLCENYGQYEVPQTYFENGTDCPNGMNVVGFRTAYWQAGRYAFFKASGDQERQRIMKNRMREFHNPFQVSSRSSAWRIGKFLEGS